MPSSSRCAVGSPSVTTRTTGSEPGCRRRCRPASMQRVLQVGALHVVRLDGGELLDGQLRRVPAEPDDLQGVLREPGRDEVRQREGGLLHRAPPAVGHHRERQVDAQRDGRGRPPLGLGDLEVLDVQPMGRTAVPPVARRRHRVADGADHVDRLLVAVLPAPRRPGQLARGAGVAQVVLRPRGRRRGRRRRVRRAVPPSRRSAFGLSVSPSAPRVTQPCRRSCAPAPAAGAGRRRRTGRAAARPPRRPRRRGWRRGAPGRAGRAGRRGRPISPRAAGRLAVAEVSLARGTRSPRPQLRSGRSARRLSVSAAICPARPAAEGLLHQRRQLLALLRADSERISRSPAAARRASSVDQLLDGAGLLREEFAVLGHELARTRRRCPRRGRACRAGR